MVADLLYDEQSEMHPIFLSMVIKASETKQISRVMNRHFILQLAIGYTVGKIL